jgi:hypothetical protein
VSLHPFSLNDPSSPLTIPPLKPWKDIVVSGPTKNITGFGFLRGTFGGPFREIRPARPPSILFGQATSHPTTPL